MFASICLLINMLTCISFAFDEVFWDERCKLDVLTETILLSNEIIHIISISVIYKPIDDDFKFQN